MRCFTFSETLPKTSRGDVFFKTSLEHRIVKQKVRCFSFQKAHSETKLLVHSSSTRNQRLQLQHLPLLHLHLLLLLLDLLVLLLPGLVAELVRGEQVTPRVRGDLRPAVDDWG